MLSTLKYFYDEYKAHVEDKDVRRGGLQNLLVVFIVLTANVCHVQRACLVQA